jgi:nitroreductase
MSVEVGSSRFEIVAEVVKTRRTIREFTDDMVPKEIVEKILDLARWSPSGGNVQDWRFVIVTDKRLLKAIKMFSPGWIGGGNPIAIVICSDRQWAYEKAGPLGRDRMYLVNAGIVAQTIALLAHSLGLGTNMIMSFSREAIKQILSLPESWEPVMIILVGYPRQIPEPPPRLPLDKLVMWK